MFDFSRVACAVTLGLLAIHSPSALAETVSGVVLDAKGQPVAAAKVALAGTTQFTRTDEAGQFVIPAPAGRQAELHIEADDFAHRYVQFTIPAQGLTQVEIRLLPTLLEVIDVTASPLHASVIESSLPVSVLAGENLRLQQAATLGDTLKYQMGVHSNFYGSVASSPIIRGLDGPRVMITQNGLDAGDASRVGPDHSVSSEAGTAQQIEVLRGPSTLFYGSGAIGGVVNVVDQRIPNIKETKGHWLVEHASVNDEKVAAASGQTDLGTVGLDQLMVYADAFYREQNNYRIPGVAELETDHDDHEDDHDEHEVKRGGRVANTDGETKGATFGSSYLLDRGFVGFALGRLERQYGIPGHAHVEEEEHDDHDQHDEERVYADLVQNRAQLQSSLQFAGPIQTLNTRFGYTDYEHAEIENGEIGTVFKNQTEEARLEFLHREFHHWKGGLSLHYKHSDFAAVGEEAFTPPNRTEMLGLGWMEERHFGPVLVQLGARMERVTLKANDLMLPELAVHRHDDHDEDHDDHDDHDHEENTPFQVDQKFNPVSLSAGAVWEFTEGYNVAAAFSFAQRAPAASELLSFGPHIGTSAYEIGALFKQNPEHDAEHAIVLNDAAIPLETSKNLDLTFRKFSGDVAVVLNLFYNQVDDYYYQQNTGLFAELGHEHDEHDDHDDHGDEGHAHGGELPVYLFRADDATLFGAEAQVIWQFAPGWQWQNQLDWVRASLDQAAPGGSRDLPRTPPLRFSSALSWQGDFLSADVRFSHYSKQQRTERLESSTDSYQLLDAQVSYYFDLGPQSLSAYLKASNLTDEDARVHTSFLKNKAPLPGRSFTLGLRGEF